MLNFINALCQFHFSLLDNNLGRVSELNVLSASFSNFYFFQDDINGSQSMHNFITLPVRENLTKGHNLI